MRARIARDVMSRDVFTFPEDGTVMELSEFLMEKGVSGVPVVNGKGKLTGVVSVTDIAEQTADLGEPVASRPSFFSLGEQRRLEPDEVRALHLENEGCLVKDIMTPTVYTIPDDTPLPAVAKTMVTGRIHRLLVTKAGRVVGIVTALDLLKVLADSTWEPAQMAAAVARE